MNSATGQLLIEVLEGIRYTCPLDMQATMIWKYGHEGTRRIRDAQEKKRRYQALKRLEARKLLKVEKVANQYKIALTDEGVQQAFWLRAQQAGFLEERFVCMVIFDIPETQKRIRQKLRYFLYEIGFIPIQRSVWVSPYDVSKDLVDLFGSVKMLRWIRIYNAEEVREK